MGTCKGSDTGGCSPSKTHGLTVVTPFTTSPRGQNESGRRGIGSIGTPRGVGDEVRPDDTHHVRKILHEDVPGANTPVMDRRPGGDVGTDGGPIDELSTKGSLKEEEVTRDDRTNGIEHPWSTMGHPVGEVKGSSRFGERFPQPPFVVVVVLADLKKDGVRGLSSNVSQTETTGRGDGPGK